MFKRENLLFVLATILIFPFLEIYRISPNSFFSIYRIFLPIYIIITGYLLINSIKINFFYFLYLVTFLLFVFINSGDNLKVSRLENTLDEVNLIYDYFISKFDRDFIYYQIIYNGTPDIFLKSMEKKNFNFNTQNKTWVLK